MKRCFLIAALLSIVSWGVLRGSDPRAVNNYDYYYGYGYGYDYDDTRDYDYGGNDVADSSTEPVNYFVGVLPDAGDGVPEDPAATEEEITLFSEEAVGRDASAFTYNGIWIDEESDLDLYYGVTRDSVTGELVPLGDGAPIGADLDIWQTNTPAESTGQAPTEDSTSTETPAGASDPGFDLDDLYDTVEAPEQTGESYCHGPFEYRNVEEYYGPYASYYYVPPGVETDESAPADATADDSAETDSAAAGDNQDAAAAENAASDSADNTADEPCEYGRYGYDEYDEYDYSEYDDDYYRYEKGYAGYTEEYNETFSENQYDPNNEYGDYGPNGVTPTADEAADAAETDTAATDEYDDEYDDGYGGEYGYYDEYGEYDAYGGYDPYGNYEESDEYEASVEEAAPAEAADAQSNPDAGTPPDSEKTNAAGSSPAGDTTNDTSMYYVDKYHYYMGMQYDGRVENPTPEASYTQTPYLEYEAYRYADDVYNVESANEPAEKNPWFDSVPPAYEEHPVIKGEQVDPSQLDLPYSVPDVSGGGMSAKDAIPVPHLLRVIYRAVEQAEPLGIFARIEWDGRRLSRLGVAQWK